jgi:hypothetical protein
VLLRLSDSLVEQGQFDLVSIQRVDAEITRVHFSAASVSVDGGSGDVIFSNSLFDGASTVAVQQGSNVSLFDTVIADTCIALRSGGIVTTRGLEVQPAITCAAGIDITAGAVLLEDTTISGCTETQPAIRVNDSGNQVELTLGGPSAPVRFSSNHVDLAVEFTQRSSQLDVANVEWTAGNGCTACRCTEGSPEFVGVPEISVCADLCVADVCN